MAEPHDESSRQRHAGWVGLRTLRQRPKAVGQTEAGETIYEVRSVRLVLRAEAAHFNRLVSCAKCGREVPGSPVLDPSGLDRPANSLICKDCVRAAGVSTYQQPEARPVEPAPDPAPVDASGLDVEDFAAEPDTVTVKSGDDTRLAAIEAQVRAMMARLNGRADGQGAESIEWLQAATSATSIACQELRQALADLRAEVAASDEAGLLRAATVDDYVKRSVAAMTEAVHGQRGDVAATVGAMAEVRSEMQQMAEAHRALVQMQRELDQRVSQLAAAVVDVSAEAAVAQSPGIERRVEEVVHDAVNHVAAAQAEISARIDELAQQGRKTETTLAALQAAVDGGASGMHMLEQQVQDSMRQLTTLADVQHRQAHAAASGSTRSVGDDLVDALEQQLQQAERRLAHLSVSEEPHS